MATQDELCAQLFGSALETDELDEALKQLLLADKEQVKEQDKVLTGLFPPSTAPLSDLRPISLMDLTLDSPHFGRVICLRISSISICRGMNIAVEDSHGK